MSDYPTTETIARIMATGYNRHVELVGPGGSYASEPMESGDGAGIVVERGGSQFAVRIERLPAMSADAAKTPGQCWTALRDEIQELRTTYYEVACDLADEGKPDERAFGRVDALDDVLLRMARMGERTMSETKRIRWSAGAEKWVTAWFGSVGTVDPHLFSILRPMAPDDEWALTSGLPGFAGRASYGGGPEPLKADAERWLEQFTSSLGASFPAAPEVATVGEQACPRCHGSGRDGRYRCPACNRDGTR